jgi:DNA-binding SARP family transcriptional activator
MREIWSDTSRRESANTLHAHMARLRKTLAGWAAADGDRVALMSRFPGYVLLIDDAAIDMSVFTRLAAQCRAAWPTDPPAASEYARKALACFHGTPFSGHNLGPLGQIARVRMEEAWLTTRETLTDASLELGLHRQCIGELEELVIAYPLYERFHEQLMVALYRCGRQAEALDVFRRARQRLHDDLGVEPSPHLHHRATQILRHDPGLWARCDSWQSDSLAGRGAVVKVTLRN